MCVQLERLAADKAAQQLQLERDLQAARQEAQQVGRSVGPNGGPLPSCGPLLQLTA